MFKRWLNSVKSFRREEDGTVAIIFALMTLVIVMLGGVAVDFGRIVDMRERIAGAVDTASLAAGRALLAGELSDDEVIELAKTFFDSNVAPAKSMGAINEPEVTVDRETGAVNIDVAAKVRMTLTRVAGFSEVDVPVTSAAVYQQRDIELGMALDVTGSMSQSVGGQQKIVALKSAFETFANRLIPDQNDAARKVRIAIAPYSSGVNLGSHVSSASGKSKDGCVTERKGGGSTDAVGNFYVKSEGSSDIDSTEGGQSYSCPTNVVVPLTSDKSALINEVNQFTPNGSTAGHMGVQWAWNLVSDEWAGVWGGDSAPDSYGRIAEGKLIKAVVLMTDGVFNTAFHGSKSAAQATALCTAMKAKGVVVFSVGFGLGANSTALQTLQNCASPGSGYFANAANPEELEAAFNRFAGTLTALRLTK